MKRIHRQAILGLFAAFATLLCSAAPAQTLPWRELQPGVEYATSGPLNIVRVTAAEWCKTERLAVAINAGMFQGDGRSNVGWAQTAKRWSEAAIGVDSHGRPRTAYTMHDFNDMLLRMPLDIAGAMHVEGGPEASLSIHTNGFDLDLAGSYETGFLENDSNDRQWPIPNVLGVIREK